MLLKTLLVSLLGFAQGDISAYMYDSTGSTSCSTLSQDTRNPWWWSGGSCIPVHNNPDMCNGKDTCGYLMDCDSSTVTISYWYSAGDMCLRGEPEQKMTYPVGKCLPSGTAGFDSQGYDFIFECGLGKTNSTGK